MASDVFDFGEHEFRGLGVTLLITAAKLQDLRLVFFVHKATNALARYIATNIFVIITFLLALLDALGHLPDLGVAAIEVRQLECRIRLLEVLELEGAQLKALGRLLLLLLLGWL
jgi:hypothetical protein